MMLFYLSFFFFQAEDGIRDYKVTGVQTCALPILHRAVRVERPSAQDAARALDDDLARGLAAALLAGGAEGDREVARPARVRDRRVEPAAGAGEAPLESRLPREGAGPFHTAAQEIPLDEREVGARVGAAAHHVPVAAGEVRRHLREDRRRADARGACIRVPGDPGLPADAAGGDEGAALVLDAQALDDHVVLVAVAGEAPGAAGERLGHHVPGAVRLQAGGGGLHGVGDRRFPAEAAAPRDAPAQHP